VKTRTKALLAVVGLVLACAAVFAVVQYLDAVAENHRLAAALQLQVTDDPHAKGRYLAPVDRIALDEVRSKAVRDSLAKRWATPVLRADASVTTREVVYVEVPAERVEGPPPELAGYWTADLPEASLSFRLPEEKFGLTLKPRKADFEIVLDDQYALHLGSLSDWLLVGDVRGVTALPRPSVWHVGGGAVWDGRWGAGVHGRVALDGWSVYAGADYVPGDEDQVRLRAGVEFPLGE
jgi:hypothetical protein